MRYRSCAQIKTAPVAVAERRGLKGELRMIVIMVNQKVIPVCKLNRTKRHNTCNITETSAVYVVCMNIPAGLILL